MSKVFRLAFLLRFSLLVFAMCSFLQAQVERGTLSGTVRDSSGAIVPGVNVIVRNVNTGVAVTTSANQSGEYVAPNLIPGEYTITASHKGFSTMTQSGIVVHVNERLVVDLALTVGEITQTVEVTAIAAQLQSESSAVGNVITRREVSELPLNG
jgi:hypothetical protein